MEHITDDIVNKRVVGPNGEDIGKVTAVDDDKAILEAPTGVSASVEDEISRADNDRLALEADQIESVTDEAVHLNADF